MKNNSKKIYCTINSIVLISIIAYLISYKKTIFVLNFKYMIIAIIPFILIHFFRIIRQYIILMEEKIKMRQLIKSYLLSSITNSILPFRIGELYKIYLYGYEIKNYKKSTVAVIIDKFFDCVVLLIAFIIIEMVTKEQLSTITIILFIFVVLIAIIYIAFESTYAFLNKYLIINKNSEFAIKCLKFLEETKEIYALIKNMISKREILIIIFTLLSWVCEIIFVFVIFKFINIGDLKLNGFISYINNSFLGVQNILSNYYINTTVFVIVLFTIIVCINKVIKKIRRE